MKTTAKKTTKNLDIAINIAEAASVILAFSVFPLHHFTTLLDHWYTNAALLFLLLSTLTLDICLTTIRCKGEFVCSCCGKVHEPSTASRIFCLYNNKKLYTRCPECKKRSWQSKVSDLSDEA